MDSKPVLLLLGYVDARAMRQGIEVSQDDITFVDEINRCDAVKGLEVRLEHDCLAGFYDLFQATLHIVDE
jgi:hypothetical protein